MASRCRVTAVRAIVLFLKNQFVERDGTVHPFFAGCFGIFGQGNVAGMGQAPQEHPDFLHSLLRNEQAMVHTATAIAKMNYRLRTPHTRKNDSGRGRCQWQDLT